MLAGHYAAAYALKAARPAVPLWALAVMVQAVDIVFFAFVPLGIETLTIDRAVDGPLAMQLMHIPYTHSLLANLGYAAVIVAVSTALRRTSVGIVLAAALLSHWGFDVFVHVPDLPLTLDGQARVGLGLWRLPVVALALELALVVGSFLLLRRVLPPGAPRRWAAGSVALLCIAQVIYVFTPPPATVLQMALVAEAIYVVVAIVVYQVDRRQRD
jgi:hypothetical protein